MGGAVPAGTIGSTNNSSDSKKGTRSSHFRSVSANLGKALLEQGSYGAVARSITSLLNDNSTSSIVIYI